MKNQNFDMVWNRKGPASIASAAGPSEAEIKRRNGSVNGRRIEVHSVLVLAM
jgi:hypothetical protein